MSTIGKLFGRSPFGLLQRHMEQVAKCVAKMGESLVAMEEGNWEKVDSLAVEVSTLEHQADQIKDDIRTHLPHRIFMPVDRNRVLEVLAIQDNLADIAEDVCVLLTYKQLAIPPRIVETFQKFRDLNIEAFLLVECIIRQLDELIEAGFGGPEAEKVRNMVHDVAYAEHQADVVQHELLKALYSSEDEFSYGAFHLWMRLITELASLSNQSENLANRIQSTLDLK